MKKHFNKELVMVKEDDECFKISTKCCICDNVYIEGNVKVRDHCHITGKYKGSAHSDCNINVSKLPNDLRLRILGNKEISGNS